MVGVLLTGDLTVVSRVVGAAARAGAVMRAADNVPQAVELCVGEMASLLIVDLSMPSLDIVGLVQHLRSAAGDVPRVVAFGPHVHEERLAAARQAGCDDVVSRGVFFARLDAILCC